MKTAIPVFYSLRVRIFHMNRKRMRIERGFTQEKFTGLTGIRVGYLSRLESPNGD